MFSDPEVHCPRPRQFELLFASHSQKGWRVMAISKPYINYKSSELKLRWVQIKRHGCSEDDWYARLSHHKRQQFFSLWLQFDLQLVFLGHRGIFQFQILHLQVQFLNKGILVHFVLIENGDASRITVGLDDDINWFSLDFPLLGLSRLTITQIAQLIKRISLNNVKLNLGRITVVAVALWVDPQLNHFLFSWQHLHTKFILFFLLEHLNEFLLFECHCLAQILILLRVILIVVVDVASNTASNPPDVDITSILMDPLFFCKFLVQQNHLV